MRRAHIVPQWSHSGPRRSLGSAGGRQAVVSPAGADGTPVTAPIVGTVYLQPEPGQPAFVQVGDRVEAGQILLIIEAMKVYNQIPAPSDGVVRQVLVSSGDPVEYGETLMILG